MSGYRSERLQITHAFQQRLLKKYFDTEHYCQIQHDVGRIRCQIMQVPVYNEVFVQRVLYHCKLYYIFKYYGRVIRTEGKRPVIPQKDLNYFPRLIWLDEKLPETSKLAEILAKNLQNCSYFIFLSICQKKCFY